MPRMTAMTVAKRPWHWAKNSARAQAVGVVLDDERNGEPGPEQADEPRLLVERRVRGAVHDVGRGAVGAGRAQCRRPRTGPRRPFPRRAPGCWRRRAPGRGRARKAGVCGPGSRVSRRRGRLRPSSRPGRSPRR
ncbi:MAG: hypothetical protein MZV64_63715 [Ignavibacteriales bacterium]|nr:hypothetical protein [Ignavibacteriales bacterium]